MLAFSLSFNFDYSGMMSIIIENKLIEVQKKANDLLIKCESSAVMNEQQEQELKANILVSAYIYTYLRI